MQRFSAKPRLIVIGNGMVGQRFLEALVNEAADRFVIEVLCEEPRLAYDRVQLSGFFSGKSAADLALVICGRSVPPGRLEGAPLVVRQPVD